VSGGIGTSASSPHVAGLAALLVESIGRSPGQIRTHLQETADDLGKPGTDPRYGKGRISVPRALGL
jgi:subtilisin family serine protease